MYVRQISRRLSDGSRARYLQLAHKVRDPVSGIPRDEVLFHFGREEQLDREQIRRLIQSLSRFLEPGDQLQVQASVGRAGAELRLERSLAYGGTFVLDALWRRLQIDQTLQRLLAERSFEIDIERLLFALVANRALDPRSKLAIERWVGQLAAVDGLDRVQVHALYRAMDFLVAHAEAIQEAVYFSTASLLNLEVDLLFFDTTSTYFEIEEPDEEEDEGLRRWGHSKDHRPDAPQVVIGLAVTRTGIPVRCWVWPGNTADASVIDQVQGDLAGWKLSRVVWVLDRGFNGEEQRLTLQRGGGQVIVGEKLRSGEKRLEPVLARAGRYQTVRDNLQVKEIVVEEGSGRQRYVLVRNPKQAERDRKKREALLERLEAEIEVLNRPRPRRGRSSGAHSKAVCKLKSHPRLGRWLRELKSGQLRVDRAAVAAEAKLDGKYLLWTSDPSLSAEDVALGYKQLAEVERAFRTLKQTLELRPLHHRLPERIRSHVLLCWLALLLIRLVETECGQTWEATRDELAKLHRADLGSKDGAFSLVSELTPSQRQILRSLQIPPPKRMQQVQLAPNDA
jgi:hypothetical protein